MQLTELCFPPSSNYNIFSRSKRLDAPNEEAKEDPTLGPPQSKKKKKNGPKLKRGVGKSLI